MATSSKQPSDQNPAIVDLRAIEVPTAAPPAEPPETAAPLILAAPTLVANPEELARRAAAEVAATEQARAVIAASPAQETAAVNPVVLPPAAIEASDSAIPSSEAAIVPVASTETVSEKPTSESSPAAGIVVSTENPEISQEAQTADAKNARFDAAVQDKSIIPESADVDTILAFMAQDSGFPNQPAEIKAVPVVSDIASSQGDAVAPKAEDISAFPTSATTVEATIAAQNTQPDAAIPPKTAAEQPKESPEPAAVVTAVKP